MSYDMDIGSLQQKDWPRFTQVPLDGLQTSSVSLEGEIQESHLPPGHLSQPSPWNQVAHFSVSFSSLQRAETKGEGGKKVPARVGSGGAKG